MEYNLASLAALPADRRVEVLDRLIGLTPNLSEADATRAIKAWVTQLIAGTKLYDRDFRMGLFEKSVTELAAIKDPMLDVAAALFPIQEENRNIAKQNSGKLARLTPVYAEAMLALAALMLADELHDLQRELYTARSAVSRAARATPCAWFPLE